MTKKDDTSKEKLIIDLIEADFTSQQIDLFRAFLCNGEDNRDRLSNTFVLWDSVPRYAVSRQQMDKVLKMGANQQKALKFHGILANLLSRKAYRRFSTSQILVAFRGVFLRAYNPMESIIFSSEKSYSPCRLKWLHRMTESLRMVSMSSFLRSSLLSLPSSLAR